MVKLTTSACACAVHEFYCPSTVKISTLNIPRFANVIPNTPGMTLKRPSLALSIIRNLEPSAYLASDDVFHSPLYRALRALRNDSYEKHRLLPSTAKLGSALHNVLLLTIISCNINWNNNTRIYITRIF